MALQTTKNVTLIGRTTAGANGDVSTIYLPGGIKTRFSGLGVFYPDLSQTQRKGIKPDVKIEKSIVNLHNDSDDILDYAIKLEIPVKLST